MQLKFKISVIWRRVYFFVSYCRLKCYEHVIHLQGKLNLPHLIILTLNDGRLQIDQTKTNKENTFNLHDI